MVQVQGNRGQVGEAIYLFLAALPGVRRQQMYWKSLATPNVVEVYCKGKNLQNISIFDKFRYLWDGKHFWWHKHVVLWSKNEHCQTSLVEMKLSFFFSRDAFFDVKLNNRLFWNKSEKHFLGIERQYLLDQSKTNFMCFEVAIKRNKVLLIRKSWRGIISALKSQVLIIN